MLHSTKQLNGFSLAARDGELGAVEDVYFDDEKWVIRHLVVDTGGWLGGRHVLLSPMAVTQIDWINSGIHVRLTRQQVETGPDIDTAKPVSRQHEMAFHDHYGFPYYWGGPLTWGESVYPGVVELGANDEAAHRRASRKDAQDMEHADPHLRSSKEVTGYTVHARDGDIGHIDDFLFDEKDWSIQLIAVDPRNWWPGKDVLIPPQCIDEVSWAEQRVSANMTRDEIEQSPKYDPMHPPTLPIRDEGRSS